MELSKLLELYEFHSTQIKDIEAKIADHPDTIKTNIEKGNKFLESVCCVALPLPLPLTNYQENIKIGTEDYRPSIKAEYIFYFGKEMSITLVCKLPDFHESYDYKYTQQNINDKQLADLFKEIDVSYIYNYLIACVNM